MTAKPLDELLRFGQSVWLDELTRDWLQGDRLRALIGEGVRGVTSNPSIFQKAIAGSHHYDDELLALARKGADAAAIYDALTLTDIRAACEELRPTYDSTQGADGFVSHEVSPRLAYDTAATIREARRLWSAVGQPNLMIKIPATDEGMPAVRTCLAEGMNINITLMFSLRHYDAVAQAYLGALEDRLAAGQSLGSTASVASFFVSRVDTLVDKLLEDRIARAADSRSADDLRSLLGQAAVANARRAYRRYQQAFGSERWSPLRDAGARVQRVLWASTSTKNPAYSDVLYVEELIGRDTVNTLPLETLEAFRDHGRVAATLTQGLDQADELVRRLAALGIDLDDVGEQLSRQGVDKFTTALDGVLATVEERRSALLAGGR